MSTFSPAPDNSQQTLISLNKRFGIAELLSFEMGRDDLITAKLKSPKGSTAELYLKGAHLTSWIPTGGEEVFFLSDKSKYRDDSIRGGVPIIFPQFGGRAVEKDLFPSMIGHGFARHSEWQVADSSADNSKVSIRLILGQNEMSQSMWPGVHCSTSLDIQIADSLHMELAVTNTGDTPLRFTGGFHPYYRVADLRTVTVSNLNGLTYEDAFENFTKKQEHNTRVPFLEPVNRVYCNAPQLFQMEDPKDQRTIQVEQSGFPDVVLWSAAPSYAEEKSDMEATDYLSFICLEPAVAASPVEVLPGQTWTGAQTVSIIS